MLNPFKKNLPDSESLYKTFIKPWLPDEEPEGMPWYLSVQRPAMPRPDIFQVDRYNEEAIVFDEIQILEPNRLEETRKMINETMTEAALEDFSSVIDFENFDVDALAKIDEFYDRKTIIALLKESDPADFSNSYMIAVCEFGTMLGFLFCEYEGFDWLYSEPYFDSIIVHSPTGIAIPVYDWAMKKFSSDGIDDRFDEKFLMAMNGIQEGSF